MDKVIRCQLNITGQVQGVGCRPYLYRLSRRLGLTGSVCNDTAGVSLQIQGTEQAIDSFISALRNDPERPALLKIENIVKQSIPHVAGECDFKIIPSDTAGAVLTQTPPDIAVCPECLAEMKETADFRYRYPFINCTQCGPRYSIVKTIPYDRPNTTMAEFRMCPRCARQYNDIADRRFHAQPVACPQCGPQIQLLDGSGKILETRSDDVIAKSAELLKAGKIIAIKGIGGFHLAADAFNENAVSLLRQRKRRQAKPFAMMALSADVVKQYATVEPAAEILLKSPAAPVVLLPKKHPNPIAPSVAQGTDCFGFMLCYAPLHHLLFIQPGVELLVMTSANLSEEPLICDNAAALVELSGIADYFLVHNRPIYRRIDDSVAHIINGAPTLLRRARGYVPGPVISDFPSSKQIFAAGADLKNTFCFLKDRRYILSEHIGDLENPRTFRHYISSVEHLAGLLQAHPQIVACDLHPGYFSTKFADEFAQSVGAEKLIPIQHHWAHAVSVMAEFNLQNPVIALIADGTGYGTDGAVWGCECLICSLTEFSRFGQMNYFPLAGGDMATIEAIRPVLGILGRAAADTGIAEILRKIEPDAAKVALIVEQIEKSVNTVPSSSLGRFFDAAAALLGLGGRNNFEAQLPMAVEALAAAGVDDSYPVNYLCENEGPVKWLANEALAAIIDDIGRGISDKIIAARFHNTVCDALLGLAQKARQACGLCDVALAGGVFCNRYLSTRLITQLQRDGFRVFFSRQTPANDGGIALGQAAIAGAMIRR